MRTKYKSFDYKLLREQAFDYYIKGQFEEAEKLLICLTEHTLNSHHYDNYIDSLLLLNSVYTNTLQYKRLGDNLFKLNVYMKQYATEEQRFLYRYHTAIFNHYYKIGDSLQEIENLVNELYKTSYYKLIVSSSSFLILICLEMHEIDKAIYYSNNIETFKLNNHFENPVARFAYRIYSFFGYYAAQKYEKSAAILEEIERTDNYTEFGQFGVMYSVAKALQLAQMDEMETAIKLFDATYDRTVFKPYLRFALGYWVNQLLRVGLYEEATKYQQLQIQILEKMYSSEINCLRKQVIEERSKQSYEHISFQDMLTNCYNRNYYEDLIKKNIKFEHYVLAVLDLDLFKLINDTGGHSKGDEAIKIVAKQLQSFMNNFPHGRVVRYGGDEFVLCIPYEYTAVKAGLFKVHKSILASTIKINEQSLNLSISMGVGYTDKVYSNIQDLFELADQALYEAKQTRGSIVTKRMHE